MMGEEVAWVFAAIRCPKPVSGEISIITILIRNLCYRALSTIRVFGKSPACICKNPRKVGFTFQEISNRTH